MRRRVRAILLASFLALHTGIMLGGPGLHALPGFDHGAAALASDQTQNPIHPDRHDSPAHDCSLCKLLAQGLVLADPADVQSAALVTARPHAEPPPSRLPSSTRPTSPRAPPHV